MTIEYTCEQLIRPIEGTREATKLAQLARQTKIEKFLLAEIMFNGNCQYRHLDFYVEEKRRDLTIRTRETGSSAGQLAEWVEAKMCYSDCIARRLTRHREGAQFEYRDMLQNDAEKQHRELSMAPTVDRDARQTLALFVFHARENHCRQKYYPDFRNRKPHLADAIKSEACHHARDVILPSLAGRQLVEDFSIALDSDSELLVFVYSDR